ncbi:glycosyltransferase family 4 protein [Marinilabilia salmonicolor]|uniref:glycosyltransferase family 4 protein n=1 Tax=Marinilabilia salmonicolor TaxID=989 RepID=UPI00031CB98A|nr:glycosyltransferase family 4 protein [Marinilabilia salmonicolor]
MKIAIVCTLYPPYINGGAEISTQLLAEGLVKSGHEVSVITTSNKNEFDILNGVEVYRIRNRNIYWRYPQREKFFVSKLLWHFIDISNYLYRIPLKRILSKINPDVVHSNNLCGLSTIIWQISSRLKIPIIHTLRDYYLICPQQAMIKNGKACIKQCNTCQAFSYAKKLKSHHVNAVVGISNFILEKHISLGYFNRSRFKLNIPNAININNNIRKKTSQSDSSIGYLGRISPEKGIEFMIDSFLKSNNKGFRLLIAGTGNRSYEKKIKDQYEKYDEIVFLGQVNSLDFFSRINLLIVPSLWNEPFGRVIIEAFSMNIPVFASKNGGLPEIVNEKVGRLFDSADQNSLIALMNKYFSNKFTFYEKDLKETASKYDNNRIISLYSELYSELLNSKEL